MLSLQQLHGGLQMGPMAIPGVMASSPTSSSIPNTDKNGLVANGGSCSVTPSNSMLFPSSSSAEVLVSKPHLPADIQLRTAILRQTPFRPQDLANNLQSESSCLMPPPPAAMVGDVDVNKSRQFSSTFPHSIMPPMNTGYQMWTPPPAFARNPTFPFAFPQTPTQASSFGVPPGQFSSLLGAAANNQALLMMMNMFPRAVQQQVDMQSSSSSSPVFLSASQEKINNKLPSRKRSNGSTLTAVSNSSSEEEDADTVASVAPRPTKREKLMSFASEHSDETSEMGLGGESRLKINFANLGNPGKHPQVFGKSRLGVPDGLSGTYVLYSERWRSDIVHEAGSEFQSEDGTKHVLITWKITNLTSGVTQSRTETPREALLRHKDGRTLCNKVFRKALEHRATELENDVKSETNPIRAKTMKNLIKKLRPKHFSEGPLVFGLRHECVQNRFKSMTFFDGQGLLQSKQ